MLRNRNTTPPKLPSRIPKNSIVLINNPEETTSPIPNAAKAEAIIIPSLTLFL